MVALESVGKTYEVGIAGVGYMLADDPEGGQGQQYQRQTAVLTPPEYAASAQAWSQSVDRYSFNQMMSMRNGAGQQYYDRPASDPQRFFDSQNVDVFTDPDVVKLVNLTDDTFYDLNVAVTNVARGLVKIGNFFYIAYVDASSNCVVDELTTAGGLNATAAFPASTGVPTAITSDGLNWYVSTTAAAGSEGIWKSSGSTTATLLVSLTNAHTVDYVAERLAVWYDDGTNYIWSTYDTAGTEEVTGGRLTFGPVGTGVQVGNTVQVGGFLYTSVRTARDLTIYAWDVTDAAPFVAAYFGAPPTSATTGVQLHGFSGAVYMSFITLGAGGFRTPVYRMPVGQDGALTTFVAAELETSTTARHVHPTSTTAAWADDGRFVYFAFNERVFVIDPATGGWSDLQYEGAVHAGRSHGLATQGTSVWNLAETSTSDWEVHSVRGSSSYEASGFIEYSTIDRASSREKRFDELTVRFKALPANTTIVVDYTVDDGATWTTLETVSTDALEVHTEALGVTARELRVRLTLTTSDGVSTPEVLAVEVKAHQLADADTLIVLPITCADNIVLMNGRPDPGNAPGNGAARVRTLEALVGTVTTFQDVDWLSGDAEETVEVMDVRVVNRVSTFDRREGRGRDFQVGLVTLRKVG